MTDVRRRRELGALLRDRGLPMRAAEVGVAEGRFSLEMLSWGLDALYMVDAWRELPAVPGDGSSPPEWHERNLAECLERVRGHGARAVILRGLSDEMAAEVPAGSLGLVYLDACHDYDWVRRDLAAWWPRLAPGGVLAGHDYLAYAGVRRAADEFAAGLGLPLRLIPEEKEEDAGFWLAESPP